MTVISSELDLMNKIKECNLERYWNNMNVFWFSEDRTIKDITLDIFLFEDGSILLTRFINKNIFYHINPIGTNSIIFLELKSADGRTFSKYVVNNNISDFILLREINNNLDLIPIQKFSVILKENPLYNKLLEEINLTTLNKLI